MKRFKRRAPSLRERLILPMLLSALIPMTVFALIISNVINASNVAAGRAETVELASRIVKEISNLESNATAAAQALSSSQTLREIYRKMFDGLTASDELDYYKLLRDTISTSMLLDDFYGIRIYLPDTDLLTREEYNFYSLSDLNPDELPEAMKRNDKVRMGWTKWQNRLARNKHSLLICKSYWVKIVLRGKNGGDMYVAVDVAMNTIQTLMLNHTDVKCSYRICGENGETLLECGSTVNAPEKRRYQVERRLEDGSTFYIEVDLAQFRSDISEYLSLLFITALVCTVLIPLFAMVISARQCKALTRLADANTQMAQGQYKRIPEDADTREIIAIQQTYNHMVMRIDDLIHNVFEEKIKKQEAQINCLFEQIKPHFLYNTLESGRWMAIRAEDTRTAKFLGKLAKYFKLGLGKGTEKVPLRSELEHIRLYVELINMRISECVSLEIDVDEEILDCMVIRLLLQPLVENAVEHGICSRSNPHGVVRITGGRQKNGLFIGIENDGVSIPREKIDALNRGEEIGLGIANVRKRLELFYGDSCSIYYENRPEGGVKSTITLEEY